MEITISHQGMWMAKKTDVIRSKSRRSCPSPRVGEVARNAVPVAKISGNDECLFAMFDCGEGMSQIRLVCEGPWRILSHVDGDAQHLSVTTLDADTEKSTMIICRCGGVADAAEKPGNYPGITRAAIKCRKCKYMITATSMDMCLLDWNYIMEDESRFYLDLGRYTARKASSQD